MVSIIKVVLLTAIFKTVYIATMQIPMDPDSKQRLADFGQPWVKIINNNNNNNAVFSVNLSSNDSHFLMKRW